MKKKNVSNKEKLESAQAGLRLSVKKILKKYGYPADKQQTAINTILGLSKSSYKNELKEKKKELENYLKEVNKRIKSLK